MWATPSTDQAASTQAYKPGKAHPASIFSYGHPAQPTGTINVAPHTGRLDRHRQATHSKLRIHVCSLPENIANKILKLDFFDMAELCPESWLFESESQEKQLSSLFKKCKQPVTDILDTVFCIIHSSPGGKVPGMYPTPHGLHVDYYWLLLQVWRLWVGFLWHRISVQGSYQKDPELVRNRLIMFTGRAKSSLRCTECFGDDHEAGQCPHTPSPLFQLPPGAAYSLPSSLSPQLSPSPWIQGPPVTPPLTCGLFNADGGPAPLCWTSSWVGQCQ